MKNHRSILEENLMLTDSRHEANHSFWKQDFEKLQGIANKTLFDTTVSKVTRTECIVIGPELTSKLNKITRSNQEAILIYCYTIHQIVCSKLLNEEIMLNGYSTLGQVAAIPSVSILTPTNTFKDILIQVQQHWNGCKKHLSFPFHRISSYSNLRLPHWVCFREGHKPNLGDIELMFEIEVSEEQLTWYFSSAYASEIELKQIATFALGLLEESLSNPNKHLKGFLPSPDLPLKQKGMLWAQRWMELAREYAKENAIQCGSSQVTYETLHCGLAMLPRLLSSQTPSGKEKLGLVVANHSLYYSTVFTLLFSGVEVVLLDMTLNQPELEGLIHNYSINILITDAPERWANMPNCMVVDLNDPSIQVHASNYSIETPTEEYQETRLTTYHHEEWVTLPLVDLLSVAEAMAPGTTEVKNLVLTGKLGSLRSVYHMLGCLLRGGTFCFTPYGGMEELSKEWHAADMIELGSHQVLELWKRSDNIIFPSVKTVYINSSTPVYQCMRELQRVFPCANLISILYCERTGIPCGFSKVGYSTITLLPDCIKGLYHHDGSPAIPGSYTTLDHGLTYSYPFISSPLRYLGNQEVIPLRNLDDFTHTSTGLLTHLERIVHQFTQVFVQLLWAPQDNVHKTIQIYLNTTNRDDSRDMEWLNKIKEREECKGYEFEVFWNPSWNRTTEGDLDFQSLPEVESDSLVGQELPISSLEEKLVTISKEILHCEVNLDDNFFDLGAHSLKAVQMVSRIYKELNYRIAVKDIFQFPTVRKLSQSLLSHAKNVSYEALEPTRPLAYFALSDAQRRLWVISQFQNGSVAYNTPGAFRIEGVLSIEHFFKSIEFVIDRHESLRTVFLAIDGIPMQKILTREEIKFQPLLVNLAHLPETEALDHAKKLAMQEATHYFDLEQGPLIRCQIVQISDRLNIFILNLHHIINDGWSTEVLVKEVLLLYHSYLHNLRIPLAPMRIQYKDYAAWQQTYLQKPEAEAHRKYWLQKLHRPLPQLELPTDAPRPTERSFHGNNLRFFLDEKQTAEISLFCRQQEVSTFMFLFTVTQLLLSKYSGQDDIILGTPLAGRNHDDLENQIGFYVNTIAIRTKVDPEVTFIQLLSNVRQSMLEAQDHQAYPFDRLVDDLTLPRDRSRSLIFDVMVTMDHSSLTDRDYLEQDGLKFSSFISEYPISKFDLTFRYTEVNNRISLLIEYDDQLFHETRIRNTFTHLRQLLVRAVDSPEHKISSYSYLDSETFLQLIQTFNNYITLPLQAKGNLIQLIHEQTQRTPDHVAVSYLDIKLTYAELELQSDRVAHGLKQRHQVEVGDRVCVMLPRTEKMPVVLLGIMKAGAAYVPIDPLYPVDRVQYLLSNSESSKMITNQTIEAITELYGSTLKIISVEDLFSEDIQPIVNPFPEENLLAYLIYTSGSTGNPKGVMIGHRSLYAFMAWCAKEYEDTPFDVIYAVSSFCFDLSIMEMFFPLTVGKRTRILPRGHDMEYALQHETQRVMLNTVPSVIDILLKEEVSLDKVTAINMAGEPIPEHIISSIPKSIEIRNLYGPSEDTTYSTCYKFPEQDNKVLIGRPIANTSLYILDNHLQPIPIACTGEIYLAGEGLALGYWNDPERTQERFIPNPFQEGTKMYRTGDLGCWTADGYVQFQGRIDHQIKWNGYRIELEEIESVVLKATGIQEAVAVYLETPSYKGIVLYYVADNASWSNDQLKSYLRDRIPHFMIPSHMVLLDKLPRNANGKIDRKALPAVTTLTTATVDGEQMQEGYMQGEVLRMAKEILAVEQLNGTDSFFDQGGNSLKAIQLVSRLRKQLSVQVDLRDVFDAHSLQELAMNLQLRERQSSYTIMLAPEQPFYELSLAQKKLWVLCAYDEVANRAYNMSYLYEVIGTLEVDIFQQALTVLHQRHEILRTVFSLHEDRPVQIIQSTMELPFAVYVQTFEDESSLRKALLKEADTEFDLENGPLFRIRVASTKEGKQIILFNVHHIICDGWSLKVLMTELFAEYIRIRNHQPSALKPLSFQFKDYVFSMEERQHETVESAAKFWKQNLRNLPAIKYLPSTEGEPNATLHQQAGLLTERIDDTQLRHLQSLARASHLTLFNLLTAATSLLLHQYSGSNDIVMGTPVANRNDSELENQIGYYLNIVPLRTAIDKQETLGNFLKKVQLVINEAFHYQHYPIEQIMADRKQENKGTPARWFEVVVDMIDFENENMDRYTIHEELTLQLMPTDEMHYARFDLTIYFQKKKDYCDIVFEYNKNKYKEEVIRKMASRFMTLIESFRQDCQHLPLAQIRSEKLIGLPSIKPGKI